VTADGYDTWKSRLLEIAFWPVAIGFFWTLDTFTKLQDRARTGVGPDDFRLITEQATSAAAALGMVLFVSWWTRRFELDLGRPLRSGVALIAGSVLFAAGHYALIVLFRILVFYFAGRQYGHAQSHLENLLFEFQKDIKIFLSMVAIMGVYRHFRAAGPAASVGDPEPASADTAMSKLLVQTGRGERVLDAAQIDYLQAARNYVSVHADGQEFVVRETLGNLENSLPDSRFVRTHRSYVVNIDRVTEIRPTDSGAWRVLLSSGADVPLSRSYRGPFKELIRG
jgi:DNA-binding LytR/AlgR family response regulator